MNFKSSVVGIRNWRFLNWAETYSCTPLLYFEPKNVDELREILRMAEANKKKLRMVGVGHSPSSIACSNDYMVSLKKFDKIIDVNAFSRPLIVLRFALFLFFIFFRLTKTNCKWKSKEECEWTPWTKYYRTITWRSVCN